MKYLLKIFTVIFALLAYMTQALSIDDISRKIQLKIAENIVKQTLSTYLHNLALPGAQEKQAQQRLDKLLAQAFRSFENDVSTQNQDVLQQIIIQNQGLLNDKKSLKEILESSSDQEQNFQKLSELITNELIENIEKSDNKQAAVKRVIEDVKSYFRQVEGFTDEDFEKIISRLNLWISNSQDNKEYIIKDALTISLRNRKSVDDIIDGLINQIVKNQIGEQKIAELLSQIQQQRQVVEKKTPEQNTQQEFPYAK